MFSYFDLLVKSRFPEKRKQALICTRNSSVCFLTSLHIHVISNKIEIFFQMLWPFQNRRTFKKLIMSDLNFVEVRDLLFNE